MAQLWLFWVAPLLGGVIGGAMYPLIVGPDVAADSPVTGQRSPATT